MRSANKITRELLRDQYLKYWQQIEIYKTWNEADVKFIARLKKEIKELKSSPTRIPT